MLVVHCIWLGIRCTLIIRMVVIIISITLSLLIIYGRKWISKVVIITVSVR